LKELEQAYPRKGWRVHFIVPAAVSDVGGQNVTLWTSGNLRHSTGVSIVFNISNRTHKAKVVPTLDASAWLMKHVKNRSVPKHDHAQPFVLAKFDIEGSEYQVLSKLMQEQLLCSDIIQKVYVEWQPWARDAEAQSKVKTELSRQSRCLPIANTKVLELGHETYALDRQPLPW